MKLKLLLFLTTATPFILYSAYHFWSYRRWKRRHAQMVKTCQFWSAQCEQSWRDWNKAAASYDGPGMDRAAQSYRVNFRRWERDVMGRK